MARILLTLLLFLFTARAECVLKQGDRIMVLGDSNTQSGLYVVALDLLIRTRLPASGIEVVPLGLASETLSGTSEKDHPFPRPDVHERLGRAFEKVQPTVVLFCYGMNDGIYAPPDAGRMALFQKGVKDIAAMAAQSKARLVAITPPPFDPKSYKGAMAAEGAAEFGYRAPWPRYNETLTGYAKWLREEPGLADAVADVHTPLSAHIASWHASHQGWSSGDGIHPIPAIHWLMAGLIAEALELPPAAAEVFAGEPGADGAWTIEVEGMPPLAHPKDAPAGFFEAAGFQKSMNRFTLTMPRAPAAVMRLKLGDQLLGMVTRNQLARGVDLTRYTSLSFNRDATAALGPALERHHLLSDAWRDHVGHTRPSTGKSKFTLEEAQAAAAPLEAKLKMLLAVRKETLRLEAVGP